MQLIVLGMHRSGTSGVTRLLNMAGAWFGPEGIATDANDENPKGFWERRDVRAVCDALLHGAGHDWWRIAGFSLDAIPADVRDEQLARLRRIVLELDAHRPWVVKEPRLCLLFPLVRPLLEVPVCIHVTREPLEVAQSVHARGDVSVQGALALWEAYTIAAFTASSGLPRLLVRHEDVMAEPVAAISGLVSDLAELGVQGLRRPNEQEISAFISPDLHRQHRSADERGLRLNGAQAELAAAIDRGIVLGLETFPPLSEGAVEELALIEEAAERRATMASLRRDAEERTRETEARLRDEAAQVRAAEQRAEAAEQRARQVAELAADLIDRAERDVRAIARSRAWRVGEGLASMRRTLTPGMHADHDGPVTYALDRLQQGRRALPDADGEAPATNGQG